MTTIQDVIGDFTPLSNNVVSQMKLVKGAIACKIFYTSNLEDRVCRMGLTRLSDEVGLNSSTVSKNIKLLIEDGYVECVKEHTATDPAHYRCTKKFYELAKGIDVINRGIDLINPSIDVINRGIDLINQEEELKEELKEEREEGRTPKKNDYLTAVVSHQAGGETVAQPDDFQQHFGYRDEFLQVYNELLGRLPALVEKDEIVELSHQPGASVERWERSIREAVLNWGGNSRQPPLQRIVEVYQHDGNYEKWRQWKYADDQPDSKPRRPRLEFVNKLTGEVTVYDSQ